MNLQENLDKIPEPPVLEKGRYRHYKGNEYEVIGLAYHTETLDSLVIYKALVYKKGAEFWARPYSMFFDTITVDGQTVRRFEKID